jgi:hypothetical protein
MPNDCVNAWRYKNWSSLKLILASAFKYGAGNAVIKEMNL